MSCAEDHVYQQCGSPCNQTCRSLSFPDMVCMELCMEGCYCPPGLYANDHGECVPSSQCACHYDGDVFQPGDVFSSHFTICCRSAQKGGARASSAQKGGARASSAQKGGALASSAQKGGTRASSAQKGGAITATSRARREGVA
ncbi:UNVERIFIED_CONTAM: hypothetical protein FKN15_048711 [Acipenser sinensis]